MTDLEARIQRVRARYPECFGCGWENPTGLGIDGFTESAGVVGATFTPRPDFAGFEGVLHGGIVAAALDEILAWTGLLVEETLAVTARLELRYRNPAPFDAVYRLEGRVDQRRGRRLEMSATCATGSKVVAEASGLFLAGDTTL